MKAFKHIQLHYQVPTSLRLKSFTSTMHIDTMSSEWRVRAFPKLIKLTHLLKGLDLINGRLVNVHNKSVIDDEFLKQSMCTFKSIGTAFVLQSLHTSANKPIYNEPFSINSLKITCDILSVSAQQRKLVRLAICPQVTQHRIWTGALMEILNRLENEMSVKTKGSNMGLQIVVNCLRFLDNAVSYDPDAASWMRLAPKKETDTPTFAKWADLLEMFDDLINCLKYDQAFDQEFDQEFLFYVMKLETMKEGLLQIKDVFVDKNLAYKEALHQQSLVHKKLSKSLGHSSRCLFTLLTYYLYGSVDEIEVDVCCWVDKGVDGEKVCLWVGKVVTSDDDEMVMKVVKQLNRAIGVVEFVHEMAEMKEGLEVEGHVWCIGSKSKSRCFDYRRHKFFVHGMSL